MNATQIYRQKLRPDIGVLDLIEDGSTVVCNGGPGLPNRFLQVLAQNATRFRDVRLCHPMRRETLDLSPELTSEENIGHILHVSDYSFDKPVIAAIRDGRAVYRPNHPTESARFFPYDVDVLVIPVSPMDRHGYFSLGAFGGWIMSFVPKARCIVLEVNPNQPRVLGHCMIHVTQAHAIFETDYPLTAIEVGAMEPSPEERALAGFVADIVPDGATLQAGVGQVPVSLLGMLKEAGKKDLGVHSEAMFDSMADLFEAGVITNARKTLHPGKFTFALVVGSRRIYDFIDDNPAAEMFDITYVADPRVICRNYRPFSINATMQVDLSGQCASETMGHLHYSGVGGQWGFHYGAALAEDGKSVMTLPSTAKGGTISRIVPMLPQGSAVSISRNDVQYVATEYGIVNLKGLTLEDRALKLISIAHPKFRDGLMRAAQDELRVILRRSHAAGATAKQETK